MADYNYYFPMRTCDKCVTVTPLPRSVLIPGYVVSTAHASMLPVAFTKGGHVTYHCTRCEHRMSNKPWKLPLLALGPLWRQVSNEHGDFLKGPLLLLPASPKQTIAVPELFTLPDLQKAVMQHPKGWTIRPTNPTKNYPLPYTAIRFGRHGLWLARGLAVDVLWAQWKEACNG